MSTKQEYPNIEELLSTGNDRQANTGKHESEPAPILEKIPDATSEIHTSTPAIDRLRERITSLSLTRGKVRTCKVEIAEQIFATLQSTSLPGQVGRIINAVLLEYIDEHKTELKSILKRNLLLED